MKELLESVATSNNWGFSYGREDFHNLYKGLNVNTPLMFLDPIISDDDINERGRTESINWSGQFLISVSSKISEKDYETRYAKYIKPIAAPAVKLIKDFFKCQNDYSIIKWRATEVINSGDFNADGLAISFLIRQYVNE